MLALVLASARDVSLARVGVTPPAACDLLRAHGVPREFGFLDIDIDGYDYHVLDALLAEFRPRVIVARSTRRSPRRFVSWSTGTRATSTATTTSSGSR